MESRLEYGYVGEFIQVVESSNVDIYSGQGKGVLELDCLEFA
tara:strand:- start:650 stop:775 length:126 start_codon:yes stop_codon:yes gene_type:complete